jgi:hypothetical protein
LILDLTGVSILEQLPMAAVTPVEGNGISGQKPSHHSAIGVAPVLSNKCRWFGIKVYAKQGVLVSVNTTPKRSKNLSRSPLS